MTNFENFLREGRIRKVNSDKIRAESLFKSSIQAIETARGILLTQNSSKTILRELYEGIREVCEALGYLYGYKFLDHESITYFIKDILKEEHISARFDRYRKLRNGINYYGEDISIESVREGLREIPDLIRKIEKHKEKL